MCDEEEDRDLPSICQTINKKRPRRAQLGIPKDYGADTPESSQKQEGVVEKRPSSYDHHWTQESVGSTENLSDVPLGTIYYNHVVG